MALTYIKPAIAKMNGRTVQLPPKTVQPHYTTFDHKKWAATVKALAGFRCERCGRADARLFADHKVELKDGGKPFDLANGQCLCGSCHTDKTNKERVKRFNAV